MPFAVYVLGLAVFAQGTSEFMLSGLVSDIAGDLSVSIASAGLLTSAFAIGMVFGAPVTALFSRGWPRRRALLLFLSVFVAVHVVGAVTSSYAVLLATRVIGALANAGFWAVALATVVAMVEPAARTRATSVVVGGVTVACVVGVPAGALLGGHWGWRAAFWAVAVVSVPALFATATSIPKGRSDAAKVSVRKELRTLRSPALWGTLVTMALVQGATFCTFAYLEPLITHATGFDDGWVPAVLALFGVGSFVGVAVAGRIVDARPVTVIVAGMAALAVGWTVLAVTAGSPPAMIGLVFVQGLLAFGTGTAMISRVFHLAADAPTLAGAFATAAFNVGAALGPWFGGLAIDAGLGFRSPVWVSALLMLLALVVAAAAPVVRRASAPTPARRRLPSVRSEPRRRAR
ncbi:Cmx/CmrA family chloramphenicol efflux MFS transporter [Streptomyces sp. SID3343]|uniref:Cmx/CmrA family chloramphenicol efflux MFS transporter n=1 Tax=Streptomyces sp. SID3343 TaxID=2690260 RepID=UPI0013679F43|nr:Cmx/CmrA family chloramphenicol efflux MFS transporter [Streptomyces sp. SID3343]MYV97459.1 Cmx/CmrA family chloramphenicol efflux MFS transporter [Streptomyces sp. SID3343]